MYKGYEDCVFDGVAKESIIISVQIKPILKTIFTEKSMANYKRNESGFSRRSDHCSLRSVSLVPK